MLNFAIVMKKKVVLYQPLLRKYINVRAHLARWRAEGLPCLFWKKTKSTLLLEKIALLECIYRLNSHLKCSFKSILQKKHESFPCGALHLYVAHKVFVEVPRFQEICSAPKMFGCAPVTYILTFHPNFHPNIWVFVTLPIYRKLINGNISLVLKTKNLLFCLVLFALETLVCF